MSEILGYRINPNTDSIEYRISTSQFVSSSEIATIAPLINFWGNKSSTKQKKAKTELKENTKFNPKKESQSEINISLPIETPQPPSQSQQIQPLNETTQNKNQIRRQSKKIKQNHFKFDEEPFIEILGLTQKAPIVKLAIRMKESPNKIFVITSKEARKLFPKQLSTYYEQFIDFI